MAAKKDAKIDLYKFPRTRHLFDAGGSGVTRDDLLMDKGEEEQFYCKPQKKGKGASAPVVVVVEEKVDGANLGISISPEHSIRVQNRSHFVDSSTHRQFSTLGAWIEEHREGLFSLLEPGRHVLFGEWLYAKHSIHYTALPDRFLGFDIYDRREETFCSSTTRDRRLAEAGLQSVRVISRTTLSGREDVKRLLDTRSAFYEGPVEGVYLRVEDEQATPPCLVRRGKVVRPDFLQQIEEQWTQQKFTKNIVQMHYDD